LTEADLHEEATVDASFRRVPIVDVESIMNFGRRHAVETEPKFMIDG
jgi:hypothetical protein